MYIALWFRRARVLFFPSACGGGGGGTRREVRVCRRVWKKKHKIIIVISNTEGGKERARFVVAVAERESLDDSIDRGGIAFVLIDRRTETG